MKTTLMAAAFAASVAMAPAGATPTYAQIETAMAQHDYVSARTMMTEVLQKRPEAVRAHALNVNLLIAEKASESTIRDEQKVARDLAGVVAVPSTTMPPSVPNHGYWLTSALIALLCVSVVGVVVVVKEWIEVKRKKRKADASDLDNYTTKLSLHQL